MKEKYESIKAVGNTVVGVVDTGEAVVICTCCSLPGFIAEEVAEAIAEALNITPVKGIGFSLPYKEARVYRDGKDR